MTTNKQLDLCSELLSKKVDKKVHHLALL